MIPRSFATAQRFPVLFNEKRRPANLVLAASAVVFILIAEVGLAYLISWLTLAPGASAPRLDVVLLFLSLSVYSLGSYAAWMSHWNIFAHIQVGFVIAAYLIPLFFTSIASRYPQPLVHRYAVICAIGAICYVVGVVLGARVAGRLSRVFASRAGVPSAAADKRAMRIAVALTIAAALGLGLSFAVAGFLPILAHDPFTAKNLKGDYQGNYASVAYLYRTSLNALAALVPITLVAWWLTRRWLILALGVISVAMLAGAGNRTPALSGALLFVGILFARRRAGVAYVILVAVMYPLVGSLFYYLLGRVGFGHFQHLYTSHSIIGIIATSTGDIFDQLEFLGRYLAYDFTTDGRTFYGALVPFQYKWNPGVWTLSIIYPGIDPNDLISGGLRLPVGLWGYTAFGTVGAAVVPFCSGTVLGIVTKVFGAAIEHGSLMRRTALLTVYGSLGLQLAGFYFLSLYSLPAIFVTVLVAWPWLRGASPTNGLSRV